VGGTLYKNLTANMAEAARGRYVSNGLILNELVLIDKILDD
jgi:hypothetical protein